MGTILTSGGGAIMESPIEGVYTSHKAPDEEKTVPKCKNCDTLLGSKDLIANIEAAEREAKEGAKAEAASAAEDLEFLARENLHEEEMQIVKRAKEELGEPPDGCLNVIILGLVLGPLPCWLIEYKGWIGDGLFVWFMVGSLLVGLAIADAILNHFGGAEYRRKLEDIKKKDIKFQQRLEAEKQKILSSEQQESEDK